MTRTLTRVLVLTGWLLSAAQAAPATASRFFTTSDGVTLHYLEAGQQHERTLLFVPGWTMPAWIWTPQLEAFSRHFHVIAFDPRGQGESAIPASGYEPVRRGKDIVELLAHLGRHPTVVVGWSLGVLDTLAAMHQGADRRLSGLVLVDNSVGEDPPPTPPAHPVKPGPPMERGAYIRAFIAHMFRRPEPPAYLERLAQASLRMPEDASKRLLAYPVPRTYWRDALYATTLPVLYAIRPRWQEQGDNLLRKRPNTWVEVFADAGHALFVDDAARFNAAVDGFLKHAVWQ
jgi:microsomal epoxide hydrolase